MLLLKLSLAGWGTCTQSSDDLRVHCTRTVYFNSKLEQLKNGRDFSKRLGAGRCSISGPCPNTCEEPALRAVNVYRVRV